MNSAFIGYGEGECYPPRLKAEVDNTLRDLLNSSYPNQPHSLLAKGVRDEVLQIWTVGLLSLCIGVTIRNLQGER